jgi:cyclic-di-GMP-binding biofilm dispersal mediator protein
VVRRELRPRRINVIDVRPPHTETGLADRAVFGSAPTFPIGLSPSVVAERIVRGIADGESELAPSAFGAA